MRQTDRCLLRVATGKQTDADERRLEQAAGRLRAHHGSSPPMNRWKAAAVLKKALKEVEQLEENDQQWPQQPAAKAAAKGAKGGTKGQGPPPKKCGSPRTARGG